MKSRIRRFLAGLLVVCMGSAAVPVPALAGIVSTDAIVSGAQRERLVSLLERTEVQARLEALGVDVAAARDRVGALSDAEAAQLASQLDELPAGGIDALGVALVVFLVLLFTDVMGYTKIFPFTRSVR
jgi:hypothetical protein